MERMLVPGLMELVKNLGVMAQRASSRRPECKSLAELVKGLLPLLLEIQRSKTPLTLPTVETFRHLMNALIQAQKVVKKMTDYSKMKLFFRDTTLTEDLRNATSEIQACVSSLPLVQLKISAEMREEVKLLKMKLGELSKDLKESQSMRQDQIDFASEVTEVLRVHNISEASSSAGSAELMDKLLSWLAQRFDSNVDTVRKEWQDMKEDVRSLRLQIQRTSENKQKLEDDLLQFIMFIDSQERICSKCASQGSGNYLCDDVLRREVQCSNCLDIFQDPLCSSCVLQGSRNHAVATLGPPFQVDRLPKEFQCSICLNVFDDPVIIGSGFTYCRQCITEWYEDNDTCPQTRTKVNVKTLIVNISIRNVISRWKETTQTGVVSESAEEFRTQLEDIPEVPISLHKLDILDNRTFNRLIGDKVQRPRVRFPSDNLIAQPSSPQPSSPQPSSPQPSSPLPSSPQHRSQQPYSPQPRSPQPHSPQSNSSQPHSPHSPQPYSPNSNSSTSQGPVKSVTTYLSLLSSNNKMQISKSLKELTSTASFPKGQMQIYEAGGIRSITKLLKDRDNTIAEKAAGVLEALTFEIRGNGGEKTLPLEQRDQISSAVIDIALEDLFDLMQFGNKLGRLKAAQAVINLLGDEEIKAEIILRRGVVTAFYRLTEVGEGFLFPNEGKALCIKGLNLLSGEKGNLAEDTALALALLRLSALEASPEVVEEALLALCSLLESGTDEIAHILNENKAVPYLVKSISHLPTGRGREEAVKILNRMSSLPGLPETIVKHELFSHLFPLLLEANEGDCLTEATRLLSTCLSGLRVDISHRLSQPEVRSFASLLTLEQTSAASKQDILSSLHYLCRESDGFRGAFLGCDGVVTLRNLAGCTRIGAFKNSIAQIIHVLAGYQSCHKDIIRQEGEQLLYCLLMDDSVDFCSEAVFATESLMTGPEGSSVSLVSFPFNNVVDLLLPSNTLECREAATGVLSVFASRVPDASDAWDEKEIHRLLDLVRSVNDLPNSIRKRAAQALLLIAKRDNSSCTAIVEADGLQIVAEFLKALGPEFTPMIINLMAICCKLDDKCKYAVLEAGGVNLFLEALEKGRMKEESAIALGNLIESSPSRQAIVQSQFIESSVKCILQNGGFQCSIDLTKALSIIIDSKTIAVRIREADGIEAMICVLKGSNEIGRRCAATTITKMIKFDSGSLPVLAKMDGIRALCNLLTFDGPQATEHFDEIEVLEALSWASEEHQNLLILVKECRIPVLLSILSSGDLTVKELTLNVLLNLSREGVPAGDSEISTGECISSAMISAKICENLFDIVNPQSPYVTDRAIFMAIGIIRNLSLVGPTARQAMLDEGDGVIKVLLDRIRYHDQDVSSEIVRGAVMALEKFMSHSKGKMLLIKAGGIKVLVQVLLGLGSGQVKTFATKILVKITQFSEASTSKQVCDTIFNANVVPGLRDILELAPDGECKRQACILLTYLMYKGPRALVCQRIRDEECISKLLELRSNPQCRKEVIEVLDLLKMYDKECKKLIAEADRKKQIHEGDLKKLNQLLNEADHEQSRSRTFVQSF